MKTQTLKIPGELTDFNTYINKERTNKFMAHKIKKEETEIIAWLCKSQGLQPMKSPVNILYQFYCKNKKKDKSNISATAKKFIEDGLVTARVLTNDGWNDISGDQTEWYIDSEDPRIEVTISSELS